MLAKGFKRKVFKPVAVLAAVILLVFLPGAVPASGGLGVQQTKLTGLDSAGSDLFGTSVSIDGDTAVVGAKGDDDNGILSGSAYVYVLDGAGAWSQQAKVIPYDGAANAEFVVSLSISGETITVGAHLDGWGAGKAGSVYVFVLEGDGSWRHQTTHNAVGDFADREFFGASVSTDGETNLVGAPGDDDDGESSGSVYVFVPFSGDS